MQSLPQHPSRYNVIDDYCTNSILLHCYILVWLNLTWHLNSMSFDEKPNPLQIMVDADELQAN